jgi:hypothetical protein
MALDGDGIKAAEVVAVAMPMAPKVAEPVMTVE